MIKFSLYPYLWWITSIFIKQFINLCLPFIFWNYDKHWIKSWFRVIHFLELLDGVAQVRYDNQRVYLINWTKYPQFYRYGIMVLQTSPLKLIMSSLGLNRQSMCPFSSGLNRQPICPNSSSPTSNNLKN